MEVGSHRLEKWLATDSCRANIQKIDQMENKR